MTAPTTRHSKFTTPTPGDVASALAEASFHMVPLCTPRPDGACALGYSHTRTKDCGKTPLLGKDWQHKASNDPHVVRSWWQRWPKANVGLVLEPSGLIVVDPDTDEAQEEAAALGLDGGLSRYSRQRAYIFKRPSGCPVANIIKWGRSKAIDLLGKGQVVVYGQHLQGCDVFLEAPSGGLVPTLPDLSDTPPWAVDALKKTAQQQEPRGDRPMSVATPDAVRHTVSRLSRYGWGLWRGDLVASQGRVVPKTEAKAGIDRSSTLFAIGSALARSGASESVICTALAERDTTLGYRKFSGRRDDQEYQRIAAKVTASHQHPLSRAAPVVRGGWEWHHA